MIGRTLHNGSSLMNGIGIGLGIGALIAGLAGEAQAAPSTYTLRQVVFKGNERVPTSELMAALPIQPGQTFRRDDLQAETDAVANVYRSHNVGANLASSLLLTGGGAATLTYTLTEQAPPPPPQHVAMVADSVSVTGNKRIPTDRILAAAAIRPGDALSNEKIAAAQAAVSALYKKANIGSSVGIDWTNTAPSHLAIVIKVVEKPDE